MSAIAAEHTRSALSLVEAVVLGIVQGLTEFLPVSSTAHLRIVPALLGWPDRGAAASAVIQLGTVLSLLVYFLRDLWQLARGATQAIGRRDFQAHEVRLALGIGLGTLPIVVAALLLEPFIEGALRGIRVIAISLIVFALVLALADRRAARARRPESSLGVRDAVLVGVAQAFALVPGASRSGVTLTGALFLGIERATAARFSFLLSIPAVLAAGLYELWQERASLLAAGNLLPMLVAVATAAVAGYAAIAAMLRLLRTRSMMVFVVYRILLGLLLLALASYHPELQ